MAKKQARQPAGPTMSRPRAPAVPDEFVPLAREAKENFDKGKFAPRKSSIRKS